MVGDSNPEGHEPEPRRNRGQVMWRVFLNAILVAAFVLAAIPVAAIVRGFIDLVTQSKIRSGGDWLAYGFAFTGLFLGAIFFAYAVKYYLSTAMVLLTTLVATGGRNGNGNGGGHGRGARPTQAGLNRIGGNGNGNGYHIDLGYNPFVSIHVAAYNEKRVIERLLTALDRLDYPEYEVVLVDDSTDESVQLLERWRNRPRFKILNRTSRQGYKGGALREALKVTDPRAEYVVIFDADSVPFPDSIDRLLPHFYRVSQGGPAQTAAAPGSDPPTEPGQLKRRAEVAAVQSYQWHVLNKSESWLTEAVRAEYAGSYMIERPFQDALGSLKMVAGTAYMIRADILRAVGWGTSITEDWELTLKLYTRGYKVVYTPWAETPAECVSTFARLARQRMRWAEGHTHNVRKWFVPILRSPVITPVEKLEFLFDATYYLQAGLFVLGTMSWLVSELIFHTHVPGWTALLGWSLLFSNVFALPLMNLGGLILEEAPVRDLQGVFGALVLSFALVPFQAWAAFKGLVGKDEGPWFRTPKTGRITDQVRHLRRLHLLRRWLLGSRAGQPALALPRPPGPPVVRARIGSANRWIGWMVHRAGARTRRTGPRLVTRARGGGRREPALPAWQRHVARLYAEHDGPVGGGPAHRLHCPVEQHVHGGFTNLPAQTIAAGIWTFTMNWDGGSGSFSDTVTLSAGVSLTASCATFVAAIPNPGTAWTTTFGSSGANTNSPFSVSTSANQLALVIPPGGSLCLQVTLTHNTGGKPSMLYDAPSATPTRGWFLPASSCRSRS